MFLTLVPWSKLRFSASLGTIAMRSQQKVDERLWCTGRVTHCETHARCKWNLLQRRFPMSPLPKHDMHLCVKLCVFHHLDVFFQHVPPNLDVAPHLQSSIVMIVIIVIIIIMMCNYMFKTFSGLFSYIDITSHMPISQKSITCAIHGAFWSQQKCLSASVSQLSIAQVDVVSLFDSLPIDWSGWLVGYEDSLRDAAWPSKLLVMLPCRKLIVRGAPQLLETSFLLMLV